MGTSTLNSLNSLLLKAEYDTLTTLVLDPEDYPRQCKSLSLKKIFFLILSLTETIDLFASYCLFCSHTKGSELLRSNAAVRFE